MNCKQGDLAIVVRVFEGMEEIQRALERDVLGRIVRCVELTTGPSGLSVWFIGEVITVQLGFMPFKVVGIEDCLLQPIRGLPVPEQVTDKVTA